MLWQVKKKVTRSQTRTHLHFSIPNPLNHELDHSATYHNVVNILPQEILQFLLYIPRETCGKRVYPLSVTLADKHALLT